jgi:hypothetical protein
MTQLIHSLGFWLEDRAIGIRLAARIDIFILCTAFRMAVKTIQANCVGTGLSPWKCSNCSMELASCFHLGPKLRKRGATYPVLPDGFIVWCLILLANILALAKTYLSTACYSRTTV